MIDSVDSVRGGNLSGQAYERRHMTRYIFVLFLGR